MLLNEEYTCDINFCAWMCWIFKNNIDPLFLKTKDLKLASLQIFIQSRVYTLKHKNE